MVADPTPAAVIFIVASVTLLVFAIIFGIASTRRAVARRRAEGRGAVPYWHTDTGLEDDRGITPLPEAHERLPEPDDRTPR
jgi:hypothetical protein